MAIMNKLICFWKRDLLLVVLDADELNRIELLLKLNWTRYLCRVQTCPVLLGIIMICLYWFDTSVEWLRCSVGAIHLLRRFRTGSGLCQVRLYVGVCVCVCVSVMGKFVLTKNYNIRCFSFAVFMDEIGAFVWQRSRGKKDTVPPMAPEFWSLVCNIVYNYHLGMAFQSLYIFVDTFLTPVCLWTSFIYRMISVSS
jgi:hypothetical protein